MARRKIRFWNLCLGGFLFKPLFKSVAQATRSTTWEIHASITSWLCWALAQKKIFLLYFDLLITTSPSLISLAEETALGCELIEPPGATRLTMEQTLPQVAIDMPLPPSIPFYQYYDSTWWTVIHNLNECYLIFTRLMQLIPVRL